MQQIQETVYMSAFVANVDEAVANIDVFEAEAERDPRLQERAAYFRAWYAVRREDGTWSFGPSKFVGYREHSAERYLGEAGHEGSRDGRQTERVLGQWFTEVDPSSALGQELARGLAAFLGKWGRVPNARARISIPEHEEIPRSPQRRSEAELLSRIVSDEGIVGGRPRIRGTRMRVVDIVEMMAEGATRAEILADFPYIADEDISAALLYAARGADHRVLRVA